MIESFMSVDTQANFEGMSIADIDIQILEFTAELYALAHEAIGTLIAERNRQQAGLERLLEFCHSGR